MPLSPEKLQKIQETLNLPPTAGFILIVHDTATGEFNTVGTAVQNEVYCFGLMALANNHLKEFHDEQRKGNKVHLFPGAFKTPNLRM